MQTHKVIVSILLARQACEHDAAREADRGSDPGDCMECSCMDVELGCTDDDLNLEFAMGRLELIDDESETGDAILSDVR